MIHPSGTMTGQFCTPHHKNGDVSPEVRNLDPRQIQIRTAYSNLEQRSPRRLITIPTGGDTESQQSARSLSEKKTNKQTEGGIRSREQRAQASRRRSAGRCIAPPAPIHLVQGGIRPVGRAAGPDLHQASPRRRGFASSPSFPPREPVRLRGWWEERAGFYSWAGGDSRRRERLGPAGARCAGRAYWGGSGPWSLGGREYWGAAPPRRPFISFFRPVVLLPSFF